MAEAAPQKPRAGSMLTVLSFVLVILVLFDVGPSIGLPRGLRTMLGEACGVVLDPLIGFGGHYPVLTILIAGSLLVALTTVLRHFTTDWIETAKNMAYMRHFQKERMTATKENNTYKLKVLKDAEPEMMRRNQQMQSKQLKSMPVTMLLAIPLFAWMSTFLLSIDYTYFSTPWNLHVDLFTTTGIIPPWRTSVFQHWILLYIVLSIPLGALIQKAMKYFAWKERWQKRHEGGTKG